MIITVFVLLLLSSIESFNFRLKKVSSVQHTTNFLKLSAKVSNNEEPKKFTLGALIQLVTMGAGAPSLGEYKRTDESGRMIFELEANNFADETGNSKQLKGKYFNEGYVGETFSVKPPSFWENLLSGGKLQSEWDEQQEKERNGEK